PLVERRLAVVAVGAPNVEVDREPRRDLALADRAVLEELDARGALEQAMVGVARLFRTALEAGAEIRRGVRRHLGSEEVERDRVPEVQVALEHVERDRAL